MKPKRLPLTLFQKRAELRRRLTIRLGSLGRDVADDICDVMFAEQELQALERQVVDVEPTDDISPEIREKVMAKLAVARQRRG